LIGGEFEVGEDLEGVGLVELRLGWVFVVDVGGGCGEDEIPLLAEVAEAGVRDEVVAGVGGGGAGEAGVFGLGDGNVKRSLFDI
jgi:hypothetical protein